MDDKNGGSASYKYGTLPSPAPLAAGFVPYQNNGAPKYERSEALTRGTLFPGLDLPFLNIANKSNPYAGTALGDLMALDFAIKELNLYLDTHASDEEAFEMLKAVISLKKEAQQKLSADCGQISLSDLIESEEYDWLRAPWPWEYCAGKGAK